MGFLEILKEMVDNVKGGVAATIMAKDGIPIQNYIKEAGYDVDSLGAEYARILQETKNAASQLKLGEVEELSVAAMGSTVIMRLINGDYFMAVVLAPEAVTGKARYYLKRAAAKAKKEL